MIKEVILCKYGEIILKGANKQNFESALVKELRRRACPYGVFKIYTKQSTIYVEPQNDLCDIDGMYAASRRVFGIIAVNRAAVCEKTMESIIETAKIYLPEKLSGKRTFKVDARRSDKAFPRTSPQISGEIGGVILSCVRGIKVDVHNPDVTVTVEVRDTNAYIRAGQEPGAGGLPLRTAGRGLLLLSGGIDSPVAGCMMAKRGMNVDCLHFHSYPYTNAQAKEKVVQLATVLSEYACGTNLYNISVTHIQEAIHEKCKPELMITLLRRFMFRIAERHAERIGAQCLITGESLGQVASQTIEGMTSSNSVIEKLPVLRPLVGFDKEEIIKRSVKMGAYEISILPYEDCCTVFLPDYPAIRPKLSEILREESKLDVEGLIAEAFTTIEKIKL